MADSSVRRQPDDAATAESRSGLEYAPAGANSKGIVDEGSRHYQLVSAGGRRMDMRVHVCDVRKPLLSVADMNDMGLDVHFFADRAKGAMAVRTGETNGIKISRVNNVFEIDATVLPWSGGTRPASKP